VRNKRGKSADVASGHECFLSSLCWCLYPGLSFCVPYSVEIMVPSWKADHLRKAHPSSALLLSVITYQKFNLGENHLSLSILHSTRNSANDKCLLLTSFTLVIFWLEKTTDAHHFFLLYFHWLETYVRTSTHSLTLEYDTLTNTYKIIFN
jgi:hypothetical protein